MVEMAVHTQRLHPLAVDVGLVQRGDSTTQPTKIRGNQNSVIYLYGRPIATEHHTQKIENLLTNTIPSTVPLATSHTIRRLIGFLMVTCQDSR